MPPTPASVHKAVLLDEVVAWLDPKESSIIVDGTAGAAGHLLALASKVGTSGMVIGLDRDPNMLALAAANVNRSLGSSEQAIPANVKLVRSPYSEIADVLGGLKLAGACIDGVLLDLGLSSDQLAWRERGFGFANDGPLDMRFDPDFDGPTAADLVNKLSEQELADLIYRYGEERHSRRIARRIVEARRVSPITTTGRLAEIVRKGVPGKWGTIDPATRTFQGLRIAVNDELGHLERALADVPDILKVGGRFAVISFHSLEDRPVKHAFRDDPRLAVLTKKPMTASTGELAANPRSRSAKLRVAERCPIPPGTITTTNPRGF